jgi:hypothetical protein
MHICHYRYPDKFSLVNLCLRILNDLYVKDIKVPQLLFSGVETRRKFAHFYVYPLFCKLESGFFSVRNRSNFIYEFYDWT